MKAEIYPSPDGWRFRIRGANNEIMAVGEAYVRRIDAEHALQTLFRAGGTVDVTVRNHGKEVVDHYTLGKAGERPEDDPSEPVYDNDPPRVRADDDPE